MNFIYLFIYYTFWLICAYLFTYLFIYIYYLFIILSCKLVPNAIMLNMFVI